MTLNANQHGKYLGTGMGIYVKLAHPLSRHPGLEKEVGQVAKVEYNLPRRGETAWTVEFRNTQDEAPESPRKYLMIKVDSSCLDKHKGQLPICDCCQIKKQQVCWEVSCRYGWRASLVAKNAPVELKEELGLTRKDYETIPRTEIKTEPTI